MKLKPRFYLIWCHDRKDYLRDSIDKEIIAFMSPNRAKQRAAAEYGYLKYGTAKREGWVEVITLEVKKEGTCNTPETQT